MSEDIRRKLKLLVDLQKLESEGGAIQSRLSSVAATLAELDASVSDVEGELQQIRDQLLVHQKMYRQHESEAQMNLSRIKKSQEKLHSVKNNKEYQSILKEIEDMQAKNSSVEDEMIAVLEQIESFEQAIGAKNAEMELIRSQVDDEKQRIRQEAMQDQQRLEKLEIEIERISAQVEPALLRKYRLVKEQTRGIAVAAVSNSVCGGCNLNIPPQMYNELQRCKALTICPHCQRIIYWEGTDPVIT